MADSAGQPPPSPYLWELRDRLDLIHVPFSDRLARIMLFRHEAGPLYIRLAERWERQQAQLGHYRQRLPILDDLEFFGPSGEPLPYELATYPDKLVFSTPLGIVQAAFLDPEALYFSLPAGPVGVRFRVQARDGTLDRRGATFHGVRNTACTFNTRLRSSRMTSSSDGWSYVEFLTDGQPPISGDAPGMLINISPRLGYNRSLPPAEEVFVNAERRWNDWFAAAPTVTANLRRQYYYAWWVMRMGLISPRYYMTREGMAPSKIHYVGVWQWDAYFHAIAYRYLDRRLAEDQLRLVLDHQRSDGMIPDAVHDEGIVDHLDTPVSADVTKPPLLGWTVLKLFEISGHKDFLDEVYGPVGRWNAWWFDKNDDDHDGIAQYNHPFSSGLDDSPLWDGGMPVESPDLNTYLCLQMDSLAAMAQIIGLESDARMWSERADRLVSRMIDHFWDPEAGLFWATRDHEPIKVLTPFSLLPLATGRLPKSIERSLIAHLLDPKEFWTRYPVPTVAADDPHYNPEQMWRGPTWVNINYLLIEALERTGHREIAMDLCTRTLDLIGRHDDIYEYYHPETGARPVKAAPIFGWTSALFIDLAIRSCQPDASASEVASGVEP